MYEGDSKEKKQKCVLSALLSQMFAFEDLVVKKQAMWERTLLVQDLLLPLREKATEVISWILLNAIKIGVGEAICIIQGSYLGENPPCFADGVANGKEDLTSTVSKLLNY